MFDRCSINGICHYDYHNFEALTDNGNGINFAIDYGKISHGINFIFLETKKHDIKSTHLKIVDSALAGVAQLIEFGLQTTGLPVRFPVRARVWVAGQVPNGGHIRGSHTVMFLSLSFSLPSPLSK